MNRSSSIVTDVNPDPFADATPDGATDIVDVGDNKAILFYPDGTVRFQHTCDRTAQGRGVIVCAPLLRIGHGHSIRQRDPLTISPSLRCGDCGTHGYIHDSIWGAR